LIPVVSAIDPVLVASSASDSDLDGYVLLNLLSGPTAAPTAPAACPPPPLHRLTPIFELDVCTTTRNPSIRSTWGAGSRAHIKRT